MRNRKGRKGDVYLHIFMYVLCWCGCMNIQCLHVVCVFWHADCVICLQPRVRSGKVKNNTGIFQGNTLHTCNESTGLLNRWDSIYPLSVTYILCIKQGYEYTFIFMVFLFFLFAGTGAYRKVRGQHWDTEGYLLEPSTSRGRCSQISVRVAETWK